MQSNISATNGQIRMAESPAVLEEEPNQRSQENSLREADLDAKLLRFDDLGSQRAEIFELTRRRLLGSWHAIPDYTPASQQHFFAVRIDSQIQ